MVCPLVQKGSFLQQNREWTGIKVANKPTGKIRKNDIKDDDLVT